MEESMDRYINLQLIRHALARMHFIVATGLIFILYLVDLIVGRFYFAPLVIFVLWCAYVQIYLRDREELYTKERLLESLKNIGWGAFGFFIILMQIITCVNNF